MLGKSRGEEGSHGLRWAASPFGLGDARSPRGHPSRISERCPGRGCPTALWGFMPRQGGSGPVSVSVAPARKSRSENPSEVKNPSQWGGSPWPAGDGRGWGHSSRPSPRREGRAGDLSLSQLPENHPSLFGDAPGAA